MLMSELIAIESNSVRLASKRLIMLTCLIFYKNYYKCSVVDHYE